MRVAAKKEGSSIKVKDLNPRSIHLYVGQILSAMYYDKDTGERRKRTIQIKKMYKHHALCKVNGRYNESYTYSELSTMLLNRRTFND